jgi:hypothetical protein
MTPLIVTGSSTELPFKLELKTTACQLKTTIGIIRLNWFNNLYFILHSVATIRKSGSGVE